MTIPFFDYLRQHKTIKNKIDTSIQRVLSSGTLILGNEVKQFEINFAKYIGSQYAIGVNSGTDAIKIALKALGIKPNDEVITVANTAVPTVSAIRECGAYPRFVDIKNDYTMNEAYIEKEITKKTRTIIAVHLYGHPCNMAYISSVARKHKLSVIEDCAQAHGASINGKKVGRFGDIGCFSFYPTKNLGAYGDAGMITTSDQKLAQKCMMLRKYGMDKEYYSKVEGYNSRLDEIQAAVLNVKLHYLDDWNFKRRQIATYYLNKIKNPNIILPIIDKINDHAFHLFVIRVRRRSTFIKYLKKYSIGYGIHYPYPIHVQKAYEFLGYKKEDLPLTYRFSKEIISLPIFPEITQKELLYIVNTLNRYS